MTNGPLEMSTSISLTVSPGEFIGNIDNNIVEPSLFQHMQISGLDDPHPERELYETSPSKTTAGQLYRSAQEHTLQLKEDAASKLKRWRHHDQRPRTATDSQNLSAQEHQDLSDFYAEVDSRMSRNSVEYPTQQARYIDRWLADTEAGPYSGVRSRSFEDSQQKGDGPNVIGIRGFSSESLVASESKRCREAYARLKQDYLRLQLEHRKLRAHIRDEANQRCERVEAQVAPSGQPPLGDMEASLRALVIKQGRRLEELTRVGDVRSCDRCRCNKNQAHSDARGETVALAVKELKFECDRLRRTADEREQEMRQMREQVARLQLEPANRKLLELTSENARLKQASDIGQVELEQVRADYLQLEARLRTLMESQKSLGHEQGDERQRLLRELCQFQVSQPKLEMLLDTERQIKLQLQEKITGLLGEREKQQEEIQGLAAELNAAQLSVRSVQTNELEKCRAELAGWHAKCTRLEEERASLEGLLRASKAKCVQLDARISSEVQHVRELHQRELAEARAESQRCERETSELRAQIRQLASKLAQCDNERRQAADQTLALHRQLELAQSAIPSERARGLVTCQQLETSERELASCREQLASCATRERELKTKLELSETQLELTGRQHADLKRRFEAQQKLVEATLRDKDRELARLRVDLNFERYNRQVSVRGIEKELRSSLRELEAMKCRFSRRLCNGIEIGRDDGDHREQSVTKPPAPTRAVAGDTLLSARKVS